MTFIVMAAITLLAGTFLFTNRLALARVINARGRRRRMRRRARQWYMD